MVGDPLLLVAPPSTQAGEQVVVQLLLKQLSVADDDIMQQRPQGLTEET